MAGGENIVFETADRLFARLFPREVLSEASRGRWPARQWDELEASGFTLALVDESLGGFGLDTADALGIVRLAARYAVPVPLAETMLANALLGRAGIQTQPGAVAICTTRDPPPIVLSRVAGGWRVTGRISAVAWPENIAAVVALATTTTSVADHLVRVPREGVTVVERCAAAAGHPIATVTIAADLSDADRAPLPAGLGADAVRGRGAALRTVGMAGAMQRILEMTVSYTQDRAQFGRPLAKFQVIQHELAKIAAQTATAAACADMVSENFLDGLSLPLVAAAKARSGEAAGIVAGLAHQLHGAIGVTREYDLHYLTKQLWRWRDEFGNETYWNEELARSALRHDGGLWPFLTGIGA